MPDVFHGWRRKAGVVALLLSVVLASWWLRSLFVVDFVRLPFESETERFHEYAIETSSGFVSLYWGEEFKIIAGPVPSPVPNKLVPGLNIDLLAAVDALQDEFTDAADGWATAQIETTTGSVITVTAELKPTIKIAFGCVVVPLTLLTMWLLLSTPRMVRKLTMSNTE